MHRPVFAAALVALCTVTAPAQAQDIEGAADHPLVGRYDGSAINGYDFKDFDAYPFPAEAGADGFESIEGAVTRISYILPEQAAMVGAVRNFRTALEGNGFDIVFECETDACGGISYDLDQFPIPRMIVDPFDYRLLSARLERPEQGDAYATVLLSPDTNGRVRVMVGVVEAAPLEIRMIDAAQMQSEVMENGRVALYGITFDTDSDVIKPDSAPTIAEIAAFLQGAPDLEVVIVGHTDNQGAMDYNLALSQRRAAAVRATLESEHGIDTARMQHAGAGFLAPVAPNTTEQGRALNRRVEIIAR